MIERKPCKTLFINTRADYENVQRNKEKKDLDFPLQLVAKSG
jgi:hypothetical protein